MTDDQGVPDDAVDAAAQAIARTLCSLDSFTGGILWPDLARIALAAAADVLRAQGAATERERILADDAAAGVYRYGYRLGAAEEREACAQLADQHAVVCARHEGNITFVGLSFADLIRARTTS